jgi:Uma2 family endonuclease
VSTPQAIQSLPKAFRYSDYLKLPDDNNLYEILKGELVVRTSPNRVHQRCSIRLSVILSLHVTQHALGEVYTAPFDVILDTENADPEILVKPDLLFVSRDQLQIITEENVQGSPDLIVEILSPSTANTDRDRKFKIYQEAKVAHYWIIDPTAQTLEEYIWQSDGYCRCVLRLGNDEFQPSLFPELVIPLEELWS